MVLDSTSFSANHASTPIFGGKQSSPFGTTSGFSFPIQKQGNVCQQSNSPFRIRTSSGSQGKPTIESCVTKQIRGPPYVATRDKYSGEITHSISAMPAYIDKSYEELRWETYESNEKGDPKTCPTPNMFTSPSVFDRSSFNSSFTPSRKSISDQFPTTTMTPSAVVNPFSNTNLYSFQSQPSITPPSSTPTFTQTKTPFPSTPSCKPMPVNSDQWPKISTSLTTPFDGKFSPSITQPISYPFSDINLYPSQTQPSILPTSSTPTFTQSLNPFFSTPSRKPMLVNSPKISSTRTTPSDGKFSPSVTQPISYQPFNNTTTTAVNPFSHINLYPSQTQPSIPQPTPVSSMTTFPTSLNPSNLNISTINTTLSTHSTSVPSLDSWPFTPRTGQTAEKVDSVSTNDQSQPSQASNGLTKAADVSSQTMNEQQYVPSSLVANPFATGSPIDQPNTVTSRHGISSLPVSNKLSTNRRTSLLRIRHVASKHPWLPSQRPSCDTKVPFFVDEPCPSAPFLPRENPRTWINSSFSLHSRSNGMQKDQHQEHNEADILATMPKLPERGEYYMEPSVTELAAKEIAEPGWCMRVNSFVVGRKGYGSIKLVGETDVRNLDIESIIQFNDREVIVYPDETKKPAVGQSINKACKVTLLNVKCVDRKTGKQHVEGRKVERFKEILMNKCFEQGAEFVSYDPVCGEWKFRVQHF